MEQQRPLRLGDLVDDYCPRERRVTNHAIVAIVEDAIRQTRCTACEADHVYKGGKAPVRKKPARTKEDEQAVLYDQVLANVTGGTPVPPPPEPVVVPVPVVVAAPAPVAAPPPQQAAAAAAPEAEPEPAAPVIDEGWSLNRPLIRASLPRNDSQPPPPRAIPEFTMHQRNMRGSQQFRGGGGNGNGNGSGNGYGGSGGSGGGWHDRSSQGANGNSNGHRGGFRPDPQGQGQGQGQGEGQSGAPNGQRPGGGRRRRRHKSPRPPQT